MKKYTILLIIPFLTGCSWMVPDEPDCPASIQREFHFPLFPVDELEEKNVTKIKGYPSKATDGTPIIIFTQDAYNSKNLEHKTTTKQWNTLIKKLKKFNKDLKEKQHKFNLPQ